MYHLAPHNRSFRWWSCGWRDAVQSCRCHENAICWKRSTFCESSAL